MLIRRILSLTLVAAAHVSAQQDQRQNLPVNSVNTFTVSSSSSDAAASFAFERGSEQTTYYVSLSLCTDVTPYPTFYVSNGPLSNLTLDLDAGFATWNGTSPNGVLIYAVPAAPIGTKTEWSFQLAVSTTGERVFSISIPRDYKLLSVILSVIFVATPVAISGVPPPAIRSPELMHCDGTALRCLQAISTNSSTNLLK